jgi:acyl carrier protein
MSHQAWQTATRPKVQASFNLHTLQPDQLDFFILLSSVSGTIGSPAQSNYAAGNTYQDGLARHLLSRGCKAVALDLGWIASAGYVTEHERAAQNLQSAGFLAPIQQQSLLGILEYYCDPALSITELGIGQVVLGLEMPNTLKGQGKEVPEFMFTPAYRVLHMQNTPGSSKAGNNGGEGDVKSPKELLEAAENIVQCTEIVADALVAKLGRTLGLDIKGIGTDKPLYEYGVDSLSALEIKNWCGKVLGANVSVLELLGAESVGEVAVLVAAKSKFIHVS